MLSAAEESFLSHGVVSVGEPEPLSIPLDGLLDSAEDPAPPAEASAPSAAPHAVDPPPSTVSGAAEGDASGADAKKKQRTDALAKTFVDYLKTCNAQLREFGNAFVLPEEAFTYIIEPCAQAVCERHAGNIEIGEREQTLVVIAGAAATAGQLYMLKRKAKMAESVIEVSEQPKPEEYSEDTNAAVTARADVVNHRKTTSLTISRPARVSDIFPPNAHGVVKPR